MAPGTAGVRGSVIVGWGIAAALLSAGAILGLRGGPPQPDASPPEQQANRSAAAPLPAPAVPALPPPSFDVVTVDRHGQAVIAGRAAPGDRVTVLDGGKTLGEATADRRGEWVLVPDAPIAPGERQLELEAAGADGGPPRRSADAVALSVAAPPDGKGPASTLAVLLPGDPSRPARILQRPEAAAGEPTPGDLPPGGPTLSVDAAEYGAGDRLVLSGRAAAGARVAVSAGDRPLGTAVADSHGTWRLSAHSGRLAAGTELHIAELGGNGAVAARLVLPLPTDAETRPGGTGAYVVRRGNSLWVIARRLYGQGGRYTAIYRANQDHIADPDRIYPGQQFKIPKS